MDNPIKMDDLGVPPFRRPPFDDGKITMSNSRIVSAGLTSSPTVFEMHSMLRPFFDIHKNTLSATDVMSGSHWYSASQEASPNDFRCLKATFDIQDGQHFPL